MRLLQTAWRILMYILMKVIIAKLRKVLLSSQLINKIFNQISYFKITRIYNGRIQAYPILYHFIYWNNFKCISSHCFQEGSFEMLLTS